MPGGTFWNTSHNAVINQKGYHIQPLPAIYLDNNEFSQRNVNCMLHIQDYFPVTCIRHLQRWLRSPQVLWQWKEWGRKLCMMNSFRTENLRHTGRKISHCRAPGIQVPVCPKHQLPKWGQATSYMWDCSVSYCPTHLANQNNPANSGCGLVSLMSTK